MRAPAVVVLDGAGRGHLLRAIAVYERQCRADGCRLPAALATLVDALGRHEPTTPDGDDEVSEAVPVAPLLLTVNEVAERLRLSSRSVERAIAAGELASVQVGRARRIAPEDLATYVEALRHRGQVAS